MESWKLGQVAICLAGILLLGGCAAATVGAGGAAGYEYSNQRALDELDADFEAGRISKEEYLERRETIRSRSVVQ